MANVVDSNVSTDNAYLKALIGECKWEMSRGKKVTLDVYFSDEGTAGKWQPWEIKAFQDVFDSISEVAGISFNIVDKESDADIVEYREKHDYFDHGENSTTLAQHSFPGHSHEGHYNVDPDTTSWNAGALKPGGSSFWTVLHEILHGVGLSHPHDDGHGSSLWPGVSGPFDSGTREDNTNLGTVMSYNSDPSMGSTATYGNVIGPMAYDIAALQALYGKNEEHEAGDSYYNLPSRNEIGTGWKSIWDAGGDDWILNPVNMGAIIDLNAATLDGGAAGAGMPSFIPGIAGGFTIANGVIIENARGNDGDDVIAGNEADNELVGLGGNDKISGRSGDDEIFGGAGDDTLQGGEGSDHLHGGKGNDTLVGNGDGDDFVGATDHLFGGDGNDRLFGDGGDDVLYGGSGRDAFYGGWGDDTIYANRHDIDWKPWLDGGDGYDTVIVDTGSSMHLRLDGTDVEKVIGNKGNDVIDGTGVGVALHLDGGLGNDTLTGGDAGDTLIGGYGNNRLTGGRGHDYLIGGENTDTFVITAESEIDEIFNFQSGEDSIDLSTVWGEGARGDFGDLAITNLGVDWVNRTQEFQVQVEDVTVLVHGMPIGSNLVEADFVL